MQPRYFDGKILSAHCPAPAFPELSRPSANEGGIYIPIFMIALSGLLAVAALALDAGNLYWRRTQLQSITDIAATGGLGYRALKGWAYFQGYDRSITNPGMDPTNRAALNATGCTGICTTKLTELKTKVQELIRSNLAVRGLDPARSNVANQDLVVSYSLDTDVIDISLNYNVPTYLVGYLPFMQGCSISTGCPVRVHTQAKMRDANILLVLDRSGSMNCPINDPDPSKPCACRVDTTYPNCKDPAITEPTRKIYALKNATFNFLSYFNPHKDRISMVPFQTIANVAYPIHDGSSKVRNYGADFTALESAIANLSAGGNTNQCDGLWTAYGDLAASQSSAGTPIVGNEPFFTLLFTDGAPTAGRFAYADGTKPDSTLNKMISTSGLQNDWLQYQVEWRDDADATNRWIGPSPLVYRPSLPSNFSGGEPPSLGVPVCGNFNPSNSPPMVSDSSKYESIFYDGGDSSKKCLSKFEFYPTYAGDSSTTATVGADGGDSQLDASLDFANQSGSKNSPYWYIQKYYDCAIEASDFLRSKGGVVFTIGLGEPAYTGTTASPNADPYQNPLNDFTRKEVFLRRLAYDRYRAQQNNDPSFKKPDATKMITDPNDVRLNNSVWFGYSEYKDYSTTTFLEQNGSYSGTNKPDELNALFTRVAKDILLQLVQ